MKETDDGLVTDQAEDFLGKSPKIRAGTWEAR